jgi:hypothetical protein
MNKYEYELNDFALSESGIHLLRNTYNYKTIAFHDIKRARIKRAVEIKNPILSLVVGIALISFSALKCLSLYKDFNDPSLHIIYIESIILPVLPGLIGIYFAYASMKKGLILQVEQGSERYKLSLKEAQKSKDVGNLKLFLKEKLSSKLETEASL